MVTINLSKLKHYNFKDVYKFVMLQSQEAFEIVITKTMIAGTDDDFMLFWEYHMAAYAGEKLNKIGDHFGDNVPAAASSHPYKF